MPDPLSSPEAYQIFVYTLPEHHPSIHRSTLVYIPSGALFGRIKGMLFFERDIVFCVQEYLNFDLNIIEGYGYEASQSHIPLNGPDLPTAAEYCQASYPHKDKFYWYDSFPHHNDPSLAASL